MSVVLGARECADAFLLFSVLSFYVCCFGGKGMRRCIPVDFCFVFLCLLFWGQGNAQMHSFRFLFCFLMSVVLGARECADAFLLISVLFSYVCCLGGKGMRRCIPVDFCSVFLCLLFGGQGNAQMHSI